MFGKKFKRISCIVIIGAIMFSSGIQVGFTQDIRMLPDVIPPSNANEIMQQLKLGGSDLFTMSKYAIPSRKPLVKRYTLPTNMTFPTSQSKEKEIKLSRIEQIFNDLYMKRVSQLDQTPNKNIVNFDEFQQEHDQQQGNMLNPSYFQQQQDSNDMNFSDLQEIPTLNITSKEAQGINITGVKIKDDSTIQEKNSQLDPDKILYQYGYDIFKERIINLSGESEDRLLAPGDSIVINMWGDAVDILLSGSAGFQPTMPLIIDKDGFITIPGTGNLFIAGMSLEQAKTAVKALFAQRYIGVEVDVKLQQAGAIAVYILGEVEKPGMHMLPASASVVDAIASAKGIKKNGSLRNITLSDKFKRNKTNIDLYEFIRDGVTYSRKLNRGDVIVVPPVKNIIALTGAVLSPGIFEFKQNDTLDNIVEIAGGLLPTVNRNHIQTESFNISDNSKGIEDYNSSSLKYKKVRSGDLITFYDSSEEIHNGVTLLGNVKNPRNIQLSDDMKLSDVIKSKDDLLPSTSEDVVEIERETGIGRNPQVFNLSLKKVVEGETDLRLEARDKIRVFQDVITPMIRVSGAINNPGLFPVEPDMTIKDIIGKTGLMYTSEDMVVELTKSDGVIETIYLYDLLTLNNTLRNSPVKAGDSLFFRKLKDFEKLKTVTVLGYVNNPGIYKLTQNMEFADAIRLSGGLKPTGYLKGVVFIRRNIVEAQTKILNSLIKRVEADWIQNSMKMAVNDDKNSLSTVKAVYAAQKELIENLRSRSNELYGRLVLDPGKNFVSTLNDIDMRDGDIIYIPESSDYILVTGEVYNQSALLFTPDKTVQNYINDVGGFTKKAAKKQAYIAKVNGTIIAYSQNRGKFLAATLDPGDAIVIPAKTNPPINAMGLIKDVSDIVSKNASTILTFLLLKNQI